MMWACGGGTGRRYRDGRRAGGAAERWPTCGRDDNEMRRRENQMKREEIRVWGFGVGRLGTEFGRGNGLHRVGGEFRVFWHLRMSL